MNNIKLYITVGIKMFFFTKMKRMNFLTNELNTEGTHCLNEQVHWDIY
mgnify:CR=1 FL=1